MKDYIEHHKMNEFELKNFDFLDKSEFSFDQEIIKVTVSIGEENMKVQANLSFFQNRLKIYPK